VRGWLYGLLRPWQGRPVVKWALVCNDPVLGPLIYDTFDNSEEAIAARRHDDWLVMPDISARALQHHWMQNPERWRAAASQQREIDELKTELSIARAEVLSVVAERIEP
jgi:hypothetical protein